VASVLYVGGIEGDEPLSLALFARGWTFALPLLSILLAHEFGHYFAALLHGVPASLPYFLPMPLSPLGTWGAVIGMPARITSRKALLDIGAAGPLAGMLLAVPILAYGLSLSEIKPLSSPSIMEGQCLLYHAIKLAVLGRLIPDGYDVFLHPAAFAGWAGLFVTMINLLPFGQLDGGHIAYALLGPRQDKIARVVRLALLPLFLFNLGRNLLAASGQGYSSDAVKLAVSNSLFWLMWFGMLSLLTRVSGAGHPPTDPGQTLDPARKGVAIFCLVLFVLLFMPAPFTQM
jgi:membrane-associated protease RseP (regulator of RpoE activity)